MTQNRAVPAKPASPKGRLTLRFRDVLHDLLSSANRNRSRLDFLKQSCGRLLEFSGCDNVTIRIKEPGGVCCCRAVTAKDGDIRTDSPKVSCFQDRDGAQCGSIPLDLLRAMMDGTIAPTAPSFTRGGSFWTGDSARPVMVREGEGESSTTRTVLIGGEYASMVLVPIPVSNEIRGLLFLAAARREFFGPEEIQFFETIAETLGVAAAHQGAQWALRERIKELTCLYGITELAQKPEITIDLMLRTVVGILPPGWQYPEITQARITLDGHVFQTERFQEHPWKQSAPLLLGGEPRGSIEIVYEEQRPDMDEGPFLKEERDLIDAVAETLGVAVSHHNAQDALRERVKELTCLYGIAKVATRPGITIEEMLRDVVLLLLPAWQYPSLTAARIVIDGRSVATPGFKDSPFRQTSDVRTDGRKRGTVEVVYLERTRDWDEGPFLKEERSLIDEIARQLGLIIEHREAEEDKARLQDQLRHADRLATIGQLSAGAAHELNEPLGSILGFAQLARKAEGLPLQAEHDIDRIVQAALHAREVIRKLMLFSRQMPTRKAPCDLNALVREGLYLVESRCAKEGIEVVHDLQEMLPVVLADPSQIHQVLVNLAVNAIQAMPRGGTLTLRTSATDDRVSLRVEDTGIGMSPEIQEHLFVPFFTTKETGQGTGLGLAVVHGIVTAHGGDILVKSEAGKGSSFEVRLPINKRSSEGER